MQTIVLVASIPAILALVNLLKPFGVTGKWATLLAVILGIMLSLSDVAVNTLNPTATTYWQAAASGLILGLSAAGLYDAARIAGVNLNPVATPGGTVIRYELATDSGGLPINAMPPEGQVSAPPKRVDPTPSDHP